MLVAVSSHGVEGRRAKEALVEQQLHEECLLLLWFVAVESKVAERVDASDMNAKPGFLRRALPSPLHPLADCHQALTQVEGTMLSQGGERRHWTNPLGPTGAADEGGLRRLHH